MLRMTAAMRVTPLLLSLFFVGCQERDKQAENEGLPQQKTDATKAGNSKSLLPGEEISLADVEGRIISRYDLNSAIEKMLGARQSALLDKQSRKKVLESLVASRAMAIHAEKTLSAEELRALDLKVSNYRERLLAKAYLNANTEPQPVTDQMAAEYYSKHPERFGQKTLYEYELLLGNTTAAGEERKRLLTALQQARSSTDWSVLSEKLKSEGHAIGYRQGRGALKVLDAKLASLLKGLEPKQTSEIILQDGSPVIARLNGKKMLPVRPLTQVLAEIRKTLVPIQLKKQIKQLSTEIIKTTQVEYLN
ncbi:MAG: peptidyl-prolyl cis-trans isomerase [Sedimenticola sp.]